MMQPEKTKYSRFQA